VVRLSEGVEAFFSRRSQLTSARALFSDERVATSNAIHSRLQINADGSLQVGLGDCQPPVSHIVGAHHVSCHNVSVCPSLCVQPLSWRQRLWCGSGRQKVLETKIGRAKQRTQRIVREVGEIPSADEAFKVSPKHASLTHPRTHALALACARAI